MDRARIIAALEAVDHVIILSGLTPLHLIEELRPDVLVKGGNYNLEEVIGRREVEKYGGRGGLISTTDNHSRFPINQAKLTHPQHADGDFRQLRHRSH